MKISESDHKTENVIELFTGLPYDATNNRIIRLAPELDGLEILYSNDSSGEEFYSLRLLCWALKANGDVVGLVPWLNDIVSAPEISDPLNGKFEGYYDPGIDLIFNEAPMHKVIELETAAEYYEYQCDEENDTVQEIPDTIGTHAVLSEKGSNSICLAEVISWRLHNNGIVRGMLAEADKVQNTPILSGDDSLYPAQDDDKFRYFFQHQIANKIKAEDSEALAAISALVDDNQ
jgi:hypothetical protein